MLAKIKSNYFIVLIIKNSLKGEKSNLLITVLYYHWAVPVMEDFFCIFGIKLDPVYL